MLTIMTEEERERRLDEDLLGQFQARSVGEMVEYEEVLATNAEETVAAIKGVEERGQDLFVVGMGHGVESPLTELGAERMERVPGVGVNRGSTGVNGFPGHCVSAGGATGRRARRGPVVDTLMSPDSPGKLETPFGNKNDGCRA